MHQDGINVIAQIQRLYDLQQIIGAGFRGRSEFFTVNSQLVTRLQSAANINLRCRVGAGKDNGQSGAMTCLSQTAYSLRYLCMICEATRLPSRMLAVPIGIRKSILAESGQFTASQLAAEKSGQKASRQSQIRAALSCSNQRLARLSVLLDSASCSTQPCLWLNQTYDPEEDSRHRGVSHPRMPQSSNAGRGRIQPAMYRVRKGLSGARRNPNPAGRPGKVAREITAGP